MLAELLALNLFGIFLVFTRVGTAVALLPGLGAVYVPVRIRLTLCLVISFAVTPVIIMDLPAMPATPVGLVLIVLGEFIVGAFMATIARTILAALQIAGTFISYFASLANALVQDPIAQSQSSVISGFLTVIGITLIFVSDTHHLILRAIIDSYGLFPPGRMPMLGDFAQAVTRHLADATAIGLQMSAPFLLVAMVYYIGLGILGRLMPQLQVFFFGLPLQVSIQLWVLAICIPGIMLVLMQRMTDGYVSYLAP